MVCARIPPPKWTPSSSWRHIFHAGGWGSGRWGFFFLNTHLELPTFLWESSYYLKDGLCLSLPPPDEAVNCNKRIWLNKFPIQTLSCGQRTLWIWFLCLASCDGVESCFHCCWNSSLPSAVFHGHSWRRLPWAWQGQEEATWPGELWPSHFLLFNTWILIIFLSRKLRLRRQVCPLQSPRHP